MFKIYDYEYENRTMSFFVDDTKTGAKYVASVNLDKTKLLTVNVMCLDGAMINDGMYDQSDDMYNSIAQNVCEYSSIVSHIEDIPVLVNSEIKYQLAQLRKPILASDVENKKMGDKFYE